jgi:lambda family phage minor tail protein L
MPLQSTNLESVKLEATTLLNLLEVDATSLGGTVYRFYDGTNNNFLPVVFNGVEYQPYPFQLTDMAIDGQGSLPRPKLTLANLNGFLSSVVLQNNNLIGAKFTRKRVYARFIDAENFPNNINPYGTPDPLAAYSDEVFYINRKTNENKQTISFELVTPLELDNVKLPRRQIWAKICPFSYRGESCGYTGVPISDQNGKLFGAGGYGFTLTNLGQWSSAVTYNQGDYIYVESTLPLNEGEKIYFVCSSNGTVGVGNSPYTNSKVWIGDSCRRSFKACRDHFPSPLPLNFGGFPGVSKAPIASS